jgi:hypothetical protein
MKPCPEATRLFRVYQDKELEADQGKSVAIVRTVRLADSLNEHYVRAESCMAAGSLGCLRLATRHRHRGRILDVRVCLHEVHALRVRHECAAGYPWLPVSPEPPLLERSRRLDRRGSRG